jgi:hypothetical protein
MIYVGRGLAPAAMERNLFMSIINRFRNFFASKPEDKDDEDAPAMEMDEIWKLSDTTDFLIAINERLNARSSYGERLERLSAEEQVFYICNLLEEEVNNGGFDQFLYNSSGNYAHRVEACLRIIGANKTTDICRTAFSAYGKPIPQDRAKREKFLDKMENDEISDILSDCDDQFYEYPDPLEELCYQYILSHREKFS